MALIRGFGFAGLGFRVHCDFCLDLSTVGSFGKSEEIWSDLIWESWAEDLRFHRPSCVVEWAVDSRVPEWQLQASILWPCMQHHMSALSSVHLQTASGVRGVRELGGVWGV